MLKTRKLFMNGAAQSPFVWRQFAEHVTSLRKTNPSPKVDESSRCYWHWHHHLLLQAQEYGLAHVVEPRYPIPPHCPHCATVLALESSTGGEEPSPPAPRWHWHHHWLLQAQYRELAQVVDPVYPIPPHWPHSGTVVPVAIGAAVVDVADVAAMARVVDLATTVAMVVDAGLTTGA